LIFLKITKKKKMAKMKRELLEKKIAREMTELKIKYLIV